MSVRLCHSVPLSQNGERTHTHTHTHTHIYIYIYIYIYSWVITIKSGIINK